MPSTQTLEREAQELAAIIECTDLEFLPPAKRQKLEEPRLPGSGRPKDQDVLVEKRIGEPQGLFRALGRPTLVDRLLHGVESPLEAPAQKDRSGDGGDGDQGRFDRDGSAAKRAKDQEDREPGQRGRPRTDPSLRNGRQGRRAFYGRAPDGDDPDAHPQRT